MTTAQSLITIGIIALGTVFTRFLPFWLFPKGKPAPRGGSMHIKQLRSASWGDRVLL